MKIKHQHNHHRNGWRNKPLLAGAYSTWLIEPSSLTARLQSRYPSFAVQAVKLKMAKPLQDEASCMRLALYQQTWVREVLLKNGHQPVVFAHSVLPKHSLRGAWCRLGRLGNKPLGATLFANPKVKRTPLSYKKLTKYHALYQQAIRYTTQQPAYLWARRSIFNLNCASILVTEVFLPALLNEHSDL